MRCIALPIVLSCLATGSRGQNCSIPPLGLPLQNTTFDDGIAVNRGVQILLGEQLLGLRLSLSQNNTRVRNARDCPLAADDFSACQGSSGGVFNISTNTFNNVPPSAWNVSTIDAHPEGVTIAYGYSDATFPGISATIPQLPIEVWSDVAASNKSELPLGPSSSFLSHLVNQSWAPSRNYGLYYGSRSQNFPQDGELLVGGIDTARFDPSTQTEFPMSGYGALSDCPLQVMLADVILTNSKGNFSLFKDPDARVPACVDTIQSAFTFTNAMYGVWAQLTDHIDFDGSNYTDQLYPADREPLLGTLTIRLSNGYTSVIPHYELISFERGTDPQGKYSVLNTSRVMAAVETGQGDLGVDVPLLGGVFLSQNYLHVDYDQDKFWLANAITSSSVKPTVTTICQPAPSASSPTNSSNNGSGSKSYIGLAIGLPVGFFVVALALFVWWLYKGPDRLGSFIKHPITTIFRRGNKEDLRDPTAPVAVTRSLESWGEIGIRHGDARRASNLHQKSELNSTVSSPKTPMAREF